jgi:hypothetical protein
VVNTAEVASTTTEPDPVVDGMLKFGVAPPDDANGREAVTLVTVPTSGAEMVIEPFPFVIVTPAPAVNVVLVKLVVAVLPIST